jgi:hypothetical protein
MQVAMLALLRRHPARVHDPDEATLFVVPMMPYVSMAAGDCLGESHAQRMSRGAAALTRSPYLLRRGGHDHLLITNTFRVRAFGTWLKSLLANATLGWFEQPISPSGVRREGMCVQSRERERATRPLQRCRRDSSPPHLTLTTLSMSSSSAQALLFGLLALYHRPALPRQSLLRSATRRCPREQHHQPSNATRRAGTRAASLTPATRAVLALFPGLVACGPLHPKALYAADLPPARPCTRCAPRLPATQRVRAVRRLAVAWFTAADRTWHALA